MLRPMSLLVIATVTVIISCFSLPSLANSIRRMPPRAESPPPISGTTIAQSCRNLNRQTEVAELIRMVALIANHAVESTLPQTLNSDSVVRDGFDTYFGTTWYEHVRLAHGHFRAVYYDSLRFLIPDEADLLTSPAYGGQEEERLDPLIIECYSNPEGRSARNEPGYQSSDRSRIYLVCSSLNVLTSLPSPRVKLPVCMAINVQ